LAQLQPVLPDAVEIQQVVDRPQELAQLRDPWNRARRRNAEASLGELLGGSTSQILYLTWEFSIAR
jgi:hypothetical protein